MKRFSISAAFVAAFFCAGLAHAATGTGVVSWTPPTTYTDGSTLPRSAITANVIDCVLTPTGGGPGSCGSTPAQVAGNNTVSATVTLSYPVEGGRVCFKVRVVAGTVSSDPSADTANNCKDFAALKPNAPTNVTFTITVTVSP